MPTDYEKLMDVVREVGRFRAIGELLDWDQETQMPPKGVTARADQSALIAGLAHQRLVSDETRALLERASADDGDFAAATNIRETRRAFDRAVNVPTNLVRTIAKTSILAKDAWAKARDSSAFAEFAPSLGQLIALKKQVADHIGFKTEPYDALMDEYEPGAQAAEIATLFDDLQAQTVALLGRIQNATHRPDASILARDFPVGRQETLSRRMAEAMGFDFDAGRADVSTHPFCTTIGGSGDVRITTRYDEHFLSSGLFGTMHETGHALYEQGLPAEHAFTPMGDAVSLGFHESQSRLWENLVGRGRAFWSHHWQGLRELFPEALSDVSPDDFYRAINTVGPSLVRVEADELTYNLHIILRFEMERAMFDGSLCVADIPEAWNDRMEALLGIRPPNDREGCLQDIHWSLGAFGYFATYALGNLFAAQLFTQAEKDLPDLDNQIAAGHNAELLSWLRRKIHCHGQRFSANDLIERVTGEPPSMKPFMVNLTAKYTDVYQLAPTP